MWPRRLPLQRLKPALPARWPRMYKNNNDENLDKPCQLLEWYVKFIIISVKKKRIFKNYFIMFHVVIILCVFIIII